MRASVTRGGAPLRDAFAHDFWGADVRLASSHKSYRPLAVLSLRADAAAARALGARAPAALAALGGAPGVHHAVNLALHALAAAGAVGVASDAGLAPARALLAGAAFAAHPVHVEAVCSVVSRADLLATLALVAALRLHARAAGEAEDPAPAGLARAAAGAAALLGAWLAALVGAFSKETGLMIAPALVVADAALVPAWRAAARAAAAAATAEAAAAEAAAEAAAAAPPPPQSSSAASVVESLTPRAAGGRGSDGRLDRRSPPSAAARRVATPAPPARGVTASAVTAAAAAAAEAAEAAAVARAAARATGAPPRGPPRAPAPPNLAAIIDGASAALAMVGLGAAGAAEAPAPALGPGVSCVGRVRRSRYARAAGSAAVAAGLLALRLAANRGGRAYAWSVFENQMAGLPRGLTRALTVAQTHAWYAALLLWPSHLAYLHGYAQLRPVESLLAPPALAAAALYAALALGAAACVRARARVPAWAAATAAALFLPASNSLVWVGTEVAERLLYLPSLPLAVALAAALPAWALPFDAGDEEEGGEVAKGAGGVGVAVGGDAGGVGSGGGGAVPAPASGPPARPPRPPPSPLALAARSLVAGLFAAGAGWSVLRSGDWASELALFARGYAVSPLDVRTANNYAMAILGSPGGDAPAARAAAEALLVDAVAAQPALQYLGAANLGALAWARGDARGAVRYSWLALHSSAAAGVAERLPCGVPATLASVYLSWAQDGGFTYVDDAAPWAADEGGAAQAAWRADVLAAARRAATGRRDGGGPPPHGRVSPAGLAAVAAGSALDGGCHTAGVLHVLASAKQLLGGEVASGAGVLAPAGVPTGDAPALFDFLRALAAAGVAVRSDSVVGAAAAGAVDATGATTEAEATTTTEVVVLRAPELPSPPPGARVFFSSDAYTLPDGAPPPPARLRVSLLDIPPRRGRGAAARPAEAPLHAARAPGGGDGGGAAAGDALPNGGGAPDASAEQTASTLNMMATSARSLAASPAVAGDAATAANLRDLADGLSRVAIALAPRRAAFRTNLAVAWAGDATAGAGAGAGAGAAAGDARALLAAAEAEAREAIAAASAAGAPPGPYVSNLGFVLERAARAADEPDASALRRAALDAYERALELAPGHATIRGNVERLRAEQ